MNLTFLIALSMLDILLTHYTFFLLRKKEPVDMNMEKGLVARWIMRGNPNPRNYVLGSFFNIVVFIVAVSFATYQGIGVEVTNTVLGVMMMLNFIHVINITDVARNWSNEKYWKIRKIMRKVAN